MYVCTFPRFGLNTPLDSTRFHYSMAYHNPPFMPASWPPRQGPAHCACYRAGGEGGGRGEGWWEKRKKRAMLFSSVMSTLAARKRC